MKPAGIEIAGQPVTLMSQHVRIQSMYVGISTPSTARGQSSSTSNGGTCDTGSASTS